MYQRYGRAKLLLELLLVAGAVLYVFPFYILVTASLKSPQDLTSSPLGLPSDPTIANFQEAWQAASLGHALLNSLVITAVSVAVLIGIGSLASYVLARRASRVSNGLYLLLLAGLLTPLQLALVPLYQLVYSAGLLGSYTSLVLFYSGHLLPLTIFLYTGFIRALPSTYEEAALVDGASSFQTFRRVVLPLVRPVTGTVVILNAIFIWNDFLTPLLYTGGSAQRTLPVAIYSFVKQFTAQWNLIFAGLLLGAIPILVVFFFLQRHIIHGFGSGLKG